MRNNKNTVIKAIDISECEFLRYSKSKKCNLCDLSQVGNNGHFFCDDYNDCYYKQLKQKEQDYETLANQYNAVVEQNRQLQKELNKCRECLLKIKYIGRIRTRLCYDEDEADGKMFCVFHCPHVDDCGMFNILQIAEEGIKQ